MGTHEIYGLSASKPFKIEGREEAAINLRLRKKPPCCKTLLTGRILCGLRPVKGASILVMDKRKIPVCRAVSDEKGKYAVYGLKPGPYNAAASAKGYKASPIKKLYIRPCVNTRLSFSLKESFLFRNGTIYGTVREKESGRPLRGAACALKGKWPETYYTASTNSDGQYLFYGVRPGNYKLCSVLHGYRASCIEAAIAYNNQSLKVDIFLEKE